MFVSNHKATAHQAGWDLTDEDFKIYEIDMTDATLIEGLRKGLIGVQPGEECEIVFSGKYGFGRKSFGMIPANSALLYKIWVVGVTND
jgi:FKBP-type peptidyl-prolyl cis-trans isomerase